MRTRFDTERRPTLLLDQIVADRTLAPVGESDDDARRWMDCDLASFVENRLDAVVDPLAFDDVNRRDLMHRALGEDERIGDPRRMTWLNAFWIVDRGLRVGTVAFEITEHRQFVPVYSLYVYPEHRGRGLAYNLLRSVDTACPSAGFEGVLVGAYWTWQADVRRYLSRYKMWARSFKRSIDFVWSDLPSHAIAIDGDLAQFAIDHGGTSIALLEARRDSNRLQWTELTAMAAPEIDDEVRFLARPTFAVALALHGWPLLRSDAAFASARGYDIGGPEVLAHKIASFERLDRSRGFVPRTPTIPGLDDAIGRELETD